MVLLVVINDKKPEQQEAAQYAANCTSRQIEIPVGPGEGGQS
jgi:hypothetical protein